MSHCEASSEAQTQIHIEYVYCVCVEEIERIVIAAQCYEFWPYECEFCIGHVKQVK